MTDLPLPDLSNAQAEKGMHTANAFKCLATPVSNLFNRMSAERKAVYDAMHIVEHAKKGSRSVRESKNSWQGQRDRCVLTRLIQID
jgi:hypothetical protein